VASYDIRSGNEVGLFGEDEDFVSPVFLEWLATVLKLWATRIWAMFGLFFTWRWLFFKKNLATLNCVQSLGIVTITT